MSYDCHNLDSRDRTGTSMVLPVSEGMVLNKWFPLLECNHPSSGQYSLGRISFQTQKVPALTVPGLYSALVKRKLLTSLLFNPNSRKPFLASGKIKRGG